MLPRGILFDLDETILSVDGPSEHVWREVLGEQAARDPRFPADLLARTIQEVSREYWADEERNREGRLDVPAARRLAARMAFERVGVPDEALALKLAGDYGARKDALIRPFPGAVETLGRLTAAGVSLALITNGHSSRQRANIARFKLAGFFQIILVESEAGFGKPDPRLFGIALKHLDIAPREAWFVGDNLAHDIAGAQAVGLFGVWNDHLHRGLPPGSPVTPNRIVRSIAELVATR